MCYNRNRSDVMIYESDIEKAIISLLQNKNYDFIDENDNWISNRNLDEFVNTDILLEALKNINGIDDEDILNDAINTIKRLDNPSMFERNFLFHKMLIDGITVESKEYSVNPLIRLIDFINPNNNIFQVCHQVKYNEGKNNRIPDVVIYINGLPLVVMELKSFCENATKAMLEDAYDQLGGCSEHNGYRYDIPTLFNYNSFLVISDGVTTKVGTITSKIDRFNEWKSVSGEKGYDDSCVTQLNILIDGLFAKDRLLDFFEFLEKKKMENLQELQRKIETISSGERASGNNKEQWIKRKEEDAKIRKIQNKLQKVESEIENLNIELSSIEEKLASPELYADSIADGSLYKQYHRGKRGLVVGNSRNIVRKLIFRL